MTRNPLINLPVNAAVLLIKGYRQMIRPWLGRRRCRFYPACSHYCIDVLKEHGMLQGFWLGAKRICKCHPFHPGGFDPVPRKQHGLYTANFQNHRSEERRQAQKAR